ncbi:MAG: hypothetical protein ACI4D4_05840 [Lachnospira sp.]
MSDINSEKVLVTKRQKRIASNALVLFARIFVITIVNLYSVRYVIKGLGVEDYGIYNAIAGVVMTSSCLIPVLALSIQRFYSYTMGKGEYNKLKMLFSAGVNISFMFSLFIVIIFETIGLWFISSQLTIPYERASEAVLIFHLSLFSFVFSLLQVPYTAAVFSNENMGVYALISTLECMAKFAIAIMICYSTADHLVYYCAGMFVVSACVFISYMVVAHHKYAECSYVKVKDVKLYKEILSFSGWSLYGAIASVGMIQGSTILLNIYFGPIANAAFGISVNIYNAFMSLTNSIVLAFRPSMVKTYAENRQEVLAQLFVMCNKAIFLLLTCVAIPIVIEINTILDWWLDIVPEDTSLYVSFFVLFCVLLALHNPITIIIQSIGRIRNYHLCIETLMVVCVPMTWFLFQLNFPSYSVFVTMISLCFLSHIIRVIFLRYNYDFFSVKKYLMNFVCPCLLIAMTNVITTGLIHSLVNSSVFRMLAVFMTSFIVTIILAYLFVTSKSDKDYIRRVIHI